jgi:c-di-GMP-binding flagellar brake protein YcgR
MVGTFRFESFTPHPEAPLILRIHGVEPLLDGKLVGYEKRDYLIVQLPNVRGIKSKLYAGNKLAVIHHHEGVVQAFASEILNSVFVPQRLIFLPYPSKVEGYLIRKHPRVRCFIPARVEVAGFELNAAILDISIGGCKLGFRNLEKPAAAAIQPKLPISLGFQSFWIRNPVEVSGTVTQFSRQGKVWYCSIRFDGYEEELVRALNEYVATVQQYTGDSPGPGFFDPIR